MNKEMFNDLQRSLLMKMNRIDYQNISLIEGYEATEENYRRFKHMLDQVNEGVTWLMTYEHGGSKMKTVLSKVEIIASASRLNAFRNDDIYRTNSAVGEGLSGVAGRYGVAYDEISKLKAEMNNRLKLYLGKIDELRKQSYVIDKKRNRVKYLRYDLEKAKQSKAQKTPESLSKEDEMEREFKGVSQQTLIEMDRLVGNDGVSGILAGVAAAHAEFAEKSAAALRRVK
jgi:hypothetical protein